MQTRCLCYAFVVLALIAAPLTQARADDAGCAPQTYQHILDHHIFLPSFTNTNPFADSTAQLGLGFSVGTFTVGTPNGPEDLKLGAFSPVIDAQVRIIPGLAVSVGIGANTTIGLNDTSIINFGASTTYSFNFGVVYEFIRKENLVFSGGLVLRRPHTLAVSPLDAAESAVNSVIGNAGGDYTQSTVETQWKPTARVAYAFNPVFGVKAAAGVNFNSVSGDNPDGTKGIFAVSVDANLDPVVSVPVGIAINFNRNQILSVGANNSDVVTLGLFETFQKSFNAGFEIGKTYVNGLNATVGALTIRGYYN